jgi:hypothetical protein
MLALQLHSSFEVSPSCESLVCPSPKRPCERVAGRDTALGKLDRDAADFLDRPADQERRFERGGDDVFLTAREALA